LCFYITISLIAFSAYWRAWGWVYITKGFFLHALLFYRKSQVDTGGHVKTQKIFVIVFLEFQ
jgi:hypothetical protein